MSDPDDVPPPRTRAAKLVKLGCLLVLIGLATLLATLRVRHGGGEPYPDLTGDPLLAADALEVVVRSDEPIGNVAVSAEGRVFYTIHPESRPEGAKLLEWRDGGPVPYPDAAFQARFETPLGVVVDPRGWLWVVDHGNHGAGTPQLFAFDLAGGKLVHEHRFAGEAAPLGSFLQDLQVAPDGSRVYIADVAFWAKRPALVVYEPGPGRARRVLQEHPSVSAQDWIIRTPIKDMTFLGGLLAMKPGVDGIALDEAGEWLYYGAMCHDTLYRVPTAALQDASLSAEALAARVEAVGRKPLNDGLSVDAAGNVYITEVEHGAVMRMAPDGSLTTVVKTPTIRWADALCFGPEGWLYLADSAIPHQVLQTKAHMAKHAPYFIFRFQPGTARVPGQ